MVAVGSDCRVLLINENVTRTMPKLASEVKGIGMKCVTFSRSDGSSFCLELYADPVNTVDGYTYNRAAITTWFENHNTSPNTGQVLSDKLLVQNILLNNIFELITKLDENYVLESYFYCSITHDLFQDPVMTVDGHTYERLAIEKWLEHHNISPNTGVTLVDTRVFSNIQLKEVIKSFTNNKDVFCLASFDQSTDDDVFSDFDQIQDNACYFLFEIILGAFLFPFFTFFSLLPNHYSYVYELEDSCFI